MYQSNKTKWVQHNGDSDIDNLVVYQFEKVRGGYLNEKVLGI